METHGVVKDVIDNVPGETIEVVTINNFNTKVVFFSIFCKNVIAMLLRRSS